MGMEIERKFLVTDESWRAGAHGTAYAQGYLARGSGRTVRVRIAGGEAWLTVKGPVSGFSREEFEYPIPLQDAHRMLRLCEGPIIEKERYRIPFGKHLWEVDEFHGENAGLVIAEVELSDANEEPSLPPWIGLEVTGQPRYYNSNLTHHPYREWGPPSP